LIVDWDESYTITVEAPITEEKVVSAITDFIAGLPDRPPLIGKEYSIGSG